MNEQGYDRMKVALKIYLKNKELVSMMEDTPQITSGTETTK